MLQEINSYHTYFRGRLLKADSPVTNLDRLCYLAVEKADVTFERFEAEVTFLMAVFQHVEIRGERILQVVVTSRTWTESIRQYAEKYLVSPTDRYSHCH